MPVIAHKKTEIDKQSNKSSANLATVCGILKPLVPDVLIRMQLTTVWVKQASATSAL